MVERMSNAKLCISLANFLSLSRAMFVTVLLRERQNNFQNISLVREVDLSFCFYLVVVTTLAFTFVDCERWQVQSFLRWSRGKP